MIEIVIAVLIVGILSAIAIPSYQKYLQTNKETTAISEINAIARRLNEYRMEFPLPTDLSTVNFGNVLPLIDPWGNPYRYFPIFGHLGDHSYMNGARKDHNLHPINSDFDLYSMGPDGMSQISLQSAQSRDDIVRANDGAFVGKASTYDP
ncbi:MAG: prepilin-type cleavage/methylation protein [Actinobacteria bacterium]|nr:prepilin-type cleavage/methylation protein [Actinomycetota bacterium]